MELQSIRKGTTFVGVMYVVKFSAFYKFVYVIIFNNHRRKKLDKRERREERINR